LTQRDAITVKTYWRHTDAGITGKGSIYWGQCTYAVLSRALAWEFVCK